MAVTPISDAEIKPGISTEFDLTVSDTDMDGLEDFLATADDAAPEAAPEPEPASRNKEEDLFDFSFLAADDDEDDMSSDISGGGML